MPSLGQTFVYIIAIVVQLPVYLLVEAHMADDMTHVTVHPWFQWAKYLFWYLIYHDVIILISYAYTAEANVIACLMTWLFSNIGVNINELFLGLFPGLRSSYKKKRRRNRRRKPKLQEVYSGNEDLDKEEYEDQYQKHYQEDEVCQDEDQCKCDRFLNNLLSLVPGMMAGQASHYKRLVQKFKGTVGQ